MLVFVTLMMVLLFVMVGMGLDTGHLSYIRSQGQPAVDAAALAAVNALPTLDITEVNQRAGVLNYNSGSNPGGNNYLSSPNNLIGANNVTLINYDSATGNHYQGGIDQHCQRGAGCPRKHQPLRRGRDGDADEGAFVSYAAAQFNGSDYQRHAECERQRSGGVDGNSGHAGSDRWVRYPTETVAVPPTANRHSAGCECGERHRRQSL